MATAFAISSAPTAPASSSDCIRSRPAAIAFRGSASAVFARSSTRLLPILLPIPCPAPTLDTINPEHSQDQHHHGSSFAPSRNGSSRNASREHRIALVAALSSVGGICRSRGGGLFLPDRLRSNYRPVVAAINPVGPSS